MKLLFWSSAGIIAYTYAGYAVWLWVRQYWRRTPVLTGTSTPFVSVVMIVRNESRVLEKKLQNLLTLNYPETLYEVVIVSDGSTDGTNEILTRYCADSRLRTIFKHESQGKAAGLNDAIASARGEIVFFTDARQSIEIDAIRSLVANFADPAVGCASGELMLGDPASGESTARMGLYWKIEKSIRRLESATGSVVGATGALYAARRNLLVPVPAGTILDDVFIPMNVVRQGSRVVFDPKARAWDVADQGAEREFSRKVRTLSGNYQLLQLAPWLLRKENPLRFEFISHKLLRLAVPFALLATLITSVFIAQPIYRIALGLQLAFYGLCLLSMTRLARGPLARMADAAMTVVVLNTAAAVAFVRFVSGRRMAWNA